MNARAVAAWSMACLLIVLSTTNPVYKALVLAAALVAVGAARGNRSDDTAAHTGGMRHRAGLLKWIGVMSVVAIALNFVSAHLGDTVLFTLPAWIPGLGGPYTLEALAFGAASSALTIAAAILAAAPLSLLLEPSDVMDALPAFLSRTGAAVAASLNLVPELASAFAQVSEAQRLRGWRPRGPRSWSEVVVPVVLTSIEDSIQLAESMEARAYGSGPRTALASTALGRRDWILVAASALALCVFALSLLAGWVTGWNAYPNLQFPAVDARPVVACLLLLAPVWVWRSPR